MAEEKLVGKVIHYYGKAGVAIVELADKLAVGQIVHFKGANNDFTQAVDEMQFEHQSIPSGKAGQQVGLKVQQKTHENDSVFLVE